MSYCTAVKQSRGKIKLLNCATKVTEQAKVRLVGYCLQFGPKSLFRGHKMIKYGTPTLVLAVL